MHEINREYGKVLNSIEQNANQHYVLWRCVGRGVDSKFSTYGIRWMFSHSVLRDTVVNALYKEVNC